MVILQGAELRQMHEAYQISDVTLRQQQYDLDLDLDLSAHKARRRAADDLPGPTRAAPAPGGGRPGGCQCAWVVTAELAQRIADRLAGQVVAGTCAAHVDVEQANPLSAAAAAVLFFPLLQAVRRQGPAVSLTVHRADSRTRAQMLQLGLDRFLAYSDAAL